MTTSGPEPNDSRSIQSSTSSGTNSPGTASLLAGLKSHWAHWLLALSKDLSASKKLQVIFREAIIFSVFMAVDIFILWFISIAAGDILEKNSFFHNVYDWMKFGSFAVIAIHYFLSCLFEIKEDEESLLINFFHMKTKRREEE